ncbi:hypothetical protein GGX14DRAFT_669143 [Mycena pura]|uniref:Protein kinase domain-containing protein n=1 Tax=Mycena pura TaxID=153505 RepID=A0AAD6VS34_9AGAR|nr:hypothetical protein GGX14DRAFT_669143 [Mycena pura]
MTAMRYSACRSAANKREGLLSGEVAKKRAAMHKIMRWEGWSEDYRADRSFHDVLYSASCGTNEQATFKQALERLDIICPIRPGGGSGATKEMSQTERKMTPLKRLVWNGDWVEECVAAHGDKFDRIVSKNARKTIASFLGRDRYTPRPPEGNERDTDAFHLAEILQPAAAIASAVNGREFECTSGIYNDGVVTDLMVWRRTGEVRKGRVTIEDKKMAAFEQHGAEFLALIGQKEFPWPRRAQSPPPQVRMWVQVVLFPKVNTGRLAMDANADLGRFCGQVFFRNWRPLFSTETSPKPPAHVILEAETLAEEARLASLGAATLYVETWRRLCSWATIAWLYCVLLWKAFCGRRGVYVFGGGRPVFFNVRDDMSLFFPSLFTSRLGCGASGVVWRSAGGSQVVKLFRDPETALHEAEMLQRAQGLAAPTLQGVVEDDCETGVVMSYRGSAIRDFRETTHNQKRQIVQALKSLHERGIHHHDVREENVLLDDNGTLTLVDFDRAEVVDGLCFGCADMYILNSIVSNRIKLEACHQLNDVAFLRRPVSNASLCHTSKSARHILTSDKGIRSGACNARGKSVSAQCTWA